MRIINSIIWGIIFAFGSAFFIGLLMGVAFGKDSGLSFEDQILSLPITWEHASKGIGFIGFLLGFFGKLPGTRKVKTNKQSNQSSEPT